MNARILFIAISCMTVACFCGPWGISQDEAINSNSWELLSSSLLSIPPSVDEEVIDSGIYSDEWEFMIMPYAKLPAVKYDATVDGVTQEIDLSFGDLMDDFDVFAVSGRFEAWKSNWGVIFDSAYVDIESDFNVPGPIDVDVFIEDWITDLGVGYRFAPVKLDEVDNFPNLVVQLHGAARYHYLKQEIDLNVAPKVGGDEDWVEPMFGGTTALHLSEKIRFSFAGDVSGFGIGYHHQPFRRIRILLH